MLLQLSITLRKILLFSIVTEQFPIKQTKPGRMKPRLHSSGSISYLTYKELRPVNHPSL